MKNYADGYKHAVLEIISDAAFDRRTGMSVTLDTLVNEQGWESLYERFDMQLFKLLDNQSDLSDLAEDILDALYSISDIDLIAPFDGTIRAELEDGETEYDWVLKQDLLPFLKRWRTVLLSPPLEKD